MLVLFFCLWLWYPPRGRINVLVLGIDRRPEEGDAVRADSIMVVTADPGGPLLGLLSIPRDLYLAIPGQGENRINTAHVFGELERPGGGPARTAAAISQNLGVATDGWVRFDFAGFVDVIDAIGGIELDVPEAVIDYAYPTDDYGIMTLEIPAGPQHMDGERALQYARTRHSGSDFDRSERQQLVAQAVIGKLVRPSTWPRLVPLLAALDDVVDSNLSNRQVAKLGLAVLRAGPEGVDRLVMDQEMVTPYTTSAGAAVLVPRWDHIVPRLEQMFDLR
jgi:LCP family protein required for cell wall assembly